MDAKHVLKLVAEVLRPYIDGAYASTTPEYALVEGIAYSILDGLPEGKRAFIGACGIDPFKDSFMQPYIEHGQYYAVETNGGTEIVPADVADLGMKVGDRLDEEEREHAHRFTDAADLLKDYVEGHTILSIELKESWLARMSADGYMDCTDWTVHDSEDEAFQSLVDNYGEDA